MKQMRSILSPTTSLLAVIALLAIAGYVLDVPRLRDWGFTTEMALPTAVSFLVVALILWFLGNILSEMPCQKGNFHCLDSQTYQPQPKEIK